MEARGRTSSILLFSFLLSFAAQRPTSAQQGPTHTWVVSYVSTGNWSQDDMFQGPAWPATPSSGHWDDPGGETAGGNNAGDQYAVDAITSGSVTATLTWVPAENMTIAQDPPSSQVIVEETATASAIGGVGNGQNDTWSNGIGTHQTDTDYVVEDGSTGVITVTDSLSASTPTAPGPPYNAGDAEVSVSFSVVPHPVEVDLTGTTLNGNEMDVLTGQQVTATLVAPFEPSGWNWTTAAPGAFKNYNPALATGQLTLLAAEDKNQSTFSFYTREATDAKASCTATVTCPNGKALPVAASHALTSKKPTAAIIVDQPPAGNHVGVELVPAANGAPPYVEDNEWWWPATITVPAPFPGGTGCFFQLATPSVTNTRDATAPGASTYTMQIPNGAGGYELINGAEDNNFPYPLGWTQNPDGTFTFVDGSYTWPASGNGFSNDNPKAPVICQDIDDGGTKWNKLDVNEQFQTWVMYVPNAVAGQGTVWVPLEKLSWGWTASADTVPGPWTLEQSNPNPGDQAPSNDEPTWSSSTANFQMRPALP